MRYCNFCYKPLKEVSAATGNLMEPHGPRPFHCSCRPPHTQNEKTVEDNWETYPSPEKARESGHPDPCEICFSGEWHGRTPFA